MRFRRVRPSIELLESRVLLSRVPIIPLVDVDDTATNTEPAEFRTLQADVAAIRTPALDTTAASITLADRFVQDNLDATNEPNERADGSAIVINTRDPRGDDSRSSNDDDDEQDIRLLEDAELLDSSTQDDDPVTTLDIEIDPSTEVTDQPERTVEDAETETDAITTLANAIQQFVALPNSDTVESANRAEEVAAYTASSTEQYVEFATQQATQTANNRSTKVELSEPDAATDDPSFDPVNTPVLGIQSESSRASNDNSSSNTISIAAASLFAVSMSKPFNRLRGQSPKDSSGTLPSQPLKNVLDPIGHRRNSNSKNPRNELTMNEFFHFSKNRIGQKSRIDVPSNLQQLHEDTQTIDEIFLEGAVLTLLETPENSPTRDLENTSHSASMDQFPTLLTIGTLATAATGLAAAHRTQKQNKKSLLRRRPIAPLYNGPTVVQTN